MFYRPKYIAETKYVSAIYSSLVHNKHYSHQMGTKSNRARRRTKTALIFISQDIKIKPKNPPIPFRGGRGSSPVPPLEMTEVATHLFPFMRLDLPSFSLSSTRHISTP